MADYCEVSECERPAERGPYCALHLKRKQRKKDLHAPVVEKLTVQQRFIELCIALADAETDEQFDSRRRAALTLARQIGRKAEDEEQRPARPRGRPPKVKPADVQRLVAKLRNVSLVARRLGVGRRTVQRALRREASGCVINRKQLWRTWACPR